MNKEKMIYGLEIAKSIVADVWDKTGIDKVGDIMCSIDEAVNAIEEEEE